MVSSKTCFKMLKVLNDKKNEANKSVKAVTNDLNAIIKELSSNVKQLTDEAKSSKSQCDDLEQYSRRNNITISGIPENDKTNMQLSKPVCWWWDWTQGYRPGPSDNPYYKQPNNRRLRDIIVKFCSYRYQTLFFQERHWSNSGLTILINYLQIGYMLEKLSPKQEILFCTKPADNTLTFLKRINIFNNI